MILKIKDINGEKVLVSWMDNLPKKHQYFDSNAQKNIRVNDVKRCLSGDRKTAGGFVWKEISL